MNRTRLEDDQTAALVIANWLSDRLAGQADGERRLRRAADILDMAMWWISGPGWPLSDLAVADETKSDEGDGVVRLSSYREPIIRVMPYLVGIAVGALFAIDLGTDGITFGFGDLFTPFI